MNKNKISKILIIGHKGYLGRNLNEKLKKIKKFTIVNSRQSKRIDFSNLSISKKILNQSKPDLIINCAAKTNIDFCEKNKKIAYNSNAKIVNNLSRYCLEKNIRLIHISTDHLYNNKKKFNSESSHSILNYYAYSKFKGEYYAKKCNSLILRVNFFGYDRKKKSLINWILISSKKNKRINLFEDIYFSPLYIDTIIKFIIKLIPSKKKGIYNIGSKNEISKSDFILSIAKKFNLKLNYNIIKFSEFKNYKTIRPKNMGMNTNKFQKEFRIKLPSIEEEINKLILK